jgi:ubiquinone/menaquinone biosynthesis methyltransferase
MSPIPSETVEMPDHRLNAEGKRHAVRAMFGEIAPSYDRLNHLLSVNIDKVWRRFTVRQLEDVLARPDALALDLCCGTADLTLELEKQARTIGCDFCHPMLVIGNQKLAAHRAVRARLAEGDALQLPFADASFDAVTNAFGLRNLENVAGGLREIRRVLKPGGRAAILEFSRPVLPRLPAGIRILFPPRPASHRRTALRLAGRLHLFAEIRTELSRSKRTCRIDAAGGICEGSVSQFVGRHRGIAFG